MQEELDTTLEDNNEALKIESRKRNVFEYVNDLLDRTKTMEFSKVQFPNTGFRIKKIVVAYFRTEYNIADSTLEEWNKVVEDAHASVDSKHYCVWVRELYGSVYGIMKFLDKDGNEIKMKHFKRWDELKEKCYLERNRINDEHLGIKVGGDIYATNCYHLHKGVIEKVEHKNSVAYQADLHIKFENGQELVRPASNIGQCDTTGVTLYTDKTKLIKYYTESLDHYNMMIQRMTTSLEKIK